MESTNSVGIEPGQILAGKYRVERVIGEGGMGVVVAAYHLHLDEHVAIKFLLPEVVNNEEAVGRFAREARAAVKIKSEHVARVVDVGTLESGSPYMVMEYLQGADLAGQVSKDGALPIEAVVEYVLQACEALAEAHSIGIVHRDLKPANLFLTRRADGSPCIKVLDFGISKMTSGAGSMSMTRTATVMGSPLYMSPEQMTSTRDVDARTDIWALGAILYELLSGRTPFNADTMPQLCAMILQQQPQPVRDFRPDIPDGLQQVVLRCLEKDPARRFPTVAELAQALLPFAPRRAHISIERVSRVMLAAGLSSSVPILPSQPPAMHTGSAVTGSTQSAWGHTAGPAATSRRWLWAALAAVVVAGGAAAFVASRGPGTDVASEDSGLAAQPAPSAIPKDASTVKDAPTEQSKESAVVTRAEPAASASAPQPSASAIQQPVSAAPTAARPARQTSGVRRPAIRKATATTTAATAKPTVKSASAAAATPKPESKPATKLSDLYGDRK